MREREGERRDSRRGCVPALLPVVSCVLVNKSLIINGFSFSGNEVLPANVVEVAWG